MTCAPPYTMGLGVYDLRVRVRAGVRVSPICTTRSKESRSHVLAVPLITVRVRDR